MIRQVLSDGKFPVKIWTNDIEEEAKKQLINLSNMPFIHKHVAVMPDAHAGKGSTIGTVIATKGAIIPSAVGVDIGCGMMAWKTKLKADQISSDIILKNLRNEIESVIPVGFAENKELNRRVNFSFEGTILNEGLISFQNDSQVFLKSMRQMGSLGGGNHFIEICLDSRNDIWVLIHSGSRNIGKTIADFHINGAKGLMKQYFIELSDPDLSYLVQGTQDFKNYIHEMKWCQEYAWLNRQEMMRRVRDIFDKLFNIDSLDHLMTPNGTVVHCHHNYTQMENHFGENVWVTRKGAVSAKKGELGIIPGSMGTKSYIVRGLGNTESFCSCSHGAGRRMSRAQAKRQFTIEDLIAQTNGVECRKDNDVLDEIPGSYKDIDIVMDNQSDLVEIVETLKQVICIKG